MVSFDMRQPRLRAHMRGFAGSSVTLALRLRTLNSSLEVAASARNWPVVQLRRYGRFGSCAAIAVDPCSVRFTLTSGRQRQSADQHLNWASRISSTIAHRSF